MNAYPIPVLAAAGAGMGGEVLYAVIGSVLGEPMLGAHLATIAIVVGVTNAVLAPVAVKLVAWSLGSLKSSAPLASLATPLTIEVLTAGAESSEVKPLASTPFDPEPVATIVE